MRVTMTMGQPARRVALWVTGHTNCPRLATMAVHLNVTRTVHVPVQSKLVRQMQPVHTVHKQPVARSIMAVRAARRHQRVLCHSRVMRDMLKILLEPRAKQQHTPLHIKMVVAPVQIKPKM